MTDRIQFDSHDEAALRALDRSFAIDASGEVAVITGEMKVEITRPADADGARFLLRLNFPGGETLDVRMARAQLLEELDIQADD